MKKKNHLIQDVTQNKYNMDPMSNSAVAPFQKKKKNWNAFLASQDRNSNGLLIIQQTKYCNGFSSTYLLLKLHSFRRCCSISTLVIAIKLSVRKEVCHILLQEYKDINEWVKKQKSTGTSVHTQKTKDHENFQA